MSRFALVFAAAALVAGCRTTPVVETPVLPAPSAEPAPRPQYGGALPANSEVILRLTSRLSGEATKVGDIFTAAVDEEVTARNGEVILAAGTIATGLVTGVDDSDHAGDVAAVRLNFLRITVDSVSHPFTADILATRLDAPRDTTSRTSLGTVITREERETLLGNAMGVGAGSIIALGTGQAAADLPAGTRLVVRTRDLLQLINRE